MEQRELLKLVASWLEKYDVKYMITGAWSVIFHGRVRTSHDLDFIVELGIEDMSKIKSVLKEAKDEFIFQETAIQEAVVKKGMFNVMYGPTMDKIDFWIRGNDEYDKTRFERRIKVSAWGQKAFVASPEDTILQKLRWYKMGPIEKHLVDAAFVWQIQDSNLDKKYIRQWAKKLKVISLLPKLEKIKIEDYY